MADDQPANAPEPTRPEGESETPRISFSSHDPLPPPPQVTYTRPTLGSPPAPTPSRGEQTGWATGPSGTGDDSSFTKLGSGLAAATTFVASVVAWFLIGQWIDHRWGHPGSLPWGTLVFSLLGVAAGFLNLFRVLAATDRTRKK